MIQSMRCNKCGYDMSGPEYISNTVDSSVDTGLPIYSNQALLSLNTRSYDKITCPYCGFTGDWSK